MITGCYNPPQAFAYNPHTDSAEEIKPSYSYKLDTFNPPNYIEEINLKAKTKDLETQIKEITKNKKMQTYYRDANGRFASKNTGKTLVEIFAGEEAPLWWKEGKSSDTQISIVNGRLYNWKGIPVRAIKQFSNGKRLVSCHKVLFGLVSDSELGILDTQEVEEYLKNAGLRD